MPEEKPHDECRHASDSQGWCPLCLMAAGLRQAKRQHQEFFDHLHNAQREILQAFKSLIEQRLSALDQRKREADAEVKKAAKIQVE